MQRQTKKRNRWTLMSFAATTVMLGSSVGCVSLKHYVKRHCCVASVVPKKDNGYYHCSHCGQIIPTKGFSKCPRCMQIPVYHGYEPTCWRQWPEGWGCPPESVVNNPEFWQEGMVESDNPPPEPSSPMEEVLAPPQEFIETPPAQPVESATEPDEQVNAPLIQGPGGERLSPVPRTTPVNPPNNDSVSQRLMQPKPVNHPVAAAQSQPESPTREVTATAPKKPAPPQGTREIPLKSPGSSVMTAVKAPVATKIDEQVGKPTQPVTVQPAPAQQSKVAAEVKPIETPASVVAADTKNLEAPVDSVERRVRAFTPAGPLEMLAIDAVDQGLHQPVDVADVAQPEVSQTFPSSPATPPAKNEPLATTSTDVQSKPEEAAPVTAEEARLTDEVSTLTPTAKEVAASAKPEISALVREERSQVEGDEENAAQTTSVPQRELTKTITEEKTIPTQQPAAPAFTPVNRVPVPKSSRPLEDASIEVESVPEEDYERAVEYAREEYYQSSVVQPKTPSQSIVSQGVHEEPRVAKSILKSSQDEPKFSATVLRPEASILNAAAESKAGEEYVLVPVHRIQPPRLIQASARILEHRPAPVNRIPLGTLPIRRDR